MQESLREAAVRLRARGHRPTLQRELVLAVLIDATPAPLSMQEIRARIDPRAAISSRAVYRAVEFLVSEGLLRRVASAPVRWQSA